MAAGAPQPASEDREQGDRAPVVPPEPADGPGLAEPRRVVEALPVRAAVAVQAAAAWGQAETAAASAAGLELVAPGSEA